MKATTWPVAVRMIDVQRPLAPLTGLDTYPWLRLIVSHGSELIGSVDLETAGASVLPAERQRDVIAREFGDRLFAQHLRGILGAATSETMAPTSVSIVVPSCDREMDLRRCLESLVRQRTRHALDIVVVDNRPRQGTAQRVAREFSRVRVVTEARPGLSFARNTGIRHASGDIIVATDDDVVAPEDWIEKLIDPFSRPEVACVTGHVLPLELETEAQVLFEAYGGLGKGFEPRDFDRRWFDGHRTAVPTWIIGATANAAFRASLFREPDIGLLDEALGAGTPTGCSEDTYLFYRILKAGRTIAYTPHAFVWHRHRASLESGRQQIYAYSKGHVAYHLTTLLRDGDRRALLRFGYSLPRTYLRRAIERLRRRSSYPLSLIALEIAGNCAGPLALWRSRRRARSLGEGPSTTERFDVVSLEGPVAEESAHEPVVATLSGVARRDGRQLQPPA